MLATIIWSLMSLATPMALISFGIYGCKAKKKAPNPPPSPGVPPPSPAQPPPRKFIPPPWWPSPLNLLFSAAKAYKIEHSTRLSIHVPYEESEMKMPTEGDAKRKCFSIFWLHSTNCIVSDTKKARETKEKGGSKKVGPIVEYRIERTHYHMILPSIWISSVLLSYLDYFSVKEAKICLG